MRRLGGHLTYANVMVSILALLVLGGSGAYAAKKLKLKDNSVTSPKIKDGQVTRPDLAEGAVDSSKIVDGSVEPADVGAGLLGDRSIGRSVAGGSCNPPPLVECRGMDLTLPRAGRVLVLADALVGGNAADGSASGACQITVDGAATQPGSEATIFTNATFVPEVGISMSQVSAPLPAGQHHFGLTCAETEADSVFSDFHLSAVSLSAD